MLKWCQENVNITTQNNIIEILGERTTDIMIEELDIASQVQETGPVTSTSTLEEYQSQISQIEGETNNSIQNIQKHLIEEDIRVEYLVLRNDTFVDSGEIQAINGIDVNDVPANILNINDGFHFDTSLEFVYLRTHEPILTNNVNNHSIESILRRTNILENVTVNGIVNFKDGLESDKLDDMNIGIQNSLLNMGDQSLGNFTSISLTAEKVAAAILNDHLLKNLENENKDKEGEEPKKSVDSVNVDNLIVGGFINDVDIPTLYKYALRRKNLQNITETYYFDSVKAESLISDDLSGKQVSNNLIPITEGTYFINKDVMFNKDLSVNNLTATQNLNNINVMDGNLDVLLKKSDERQYVSGTKSFENLELLSPINLHGKIRGKAFETMSPLVKVDQDVEINGDVRITGNAVSEGTIRLKNIITNDKKKSLENLLENGVKLNSDIMPTHLVFSQHINVDDLSTDTINSIDPRSWLVNGAKQIQIVHAPKQFNGDLEIEGDTTCRRINDIDMEELEGNVLRKDGDQIISGKHYVKYVATEKMINTNSTRFGRHPWKDVLITSEHQTIHGNMFIRKDLSARSMVISNMTVRGLIESLNAKKILNDAVTINHHLRLAGDKTFRNLIIDDLKLKTSHFEKVLEQLAENTLELSNVKTLENVNVESLHFTQSFNDVSNVVLKNENETEKMMVELGDQEFNSIKVFGNVFIESNCLNNIDMSDLYLNTVKVDEPHQFDFVDFANDVIVSDTIALAGHVDNLDLDNIFQNEVGGQQTILDVLDKKHFHENVTILGAVHINGNLNGVNVSDLCGFASDIKDAGSRLILEGSRADKVPVFRSTSAFRSWVQFPATAGIFLMAQESVWDHTLKEIALITPFELFEQTRMSFGSRNAAQTFQRFIDNITRWLDLCYAYSDDILIASSSEVDHKSYLRQLFK
ncbi:unnamed protein product [Phaedon cochleariae]|uniref:Reverse transcriptase domain-containing protein n=1 Tax=Phaedon cochleariae TaxID=80249 RepID=A0A9N9X3A2_PHACE|nr:unnamed protein product [Phaedon cochleariae]